MAWSILVLGNSDIFRRRIRPAMERIASVTSIEVASRSGAGQWHDYEQALRESQANIVYISLVNKLHYAWAARAVASGFHVIIDKPATGSLAQAQKLVALARKHHVCVAEATVYAYHPQIARLQSLGQAHTLSVLFSFPPVAATNYKYSRAAAGGAVEDLGPYALTPGRIFFGEKPLKVVARVTANNGEVPLRYSFLATYSGDRTLLGHCGFTSGYVNCLQVLGDTWQAEVHRVFTTPGDQANTVMINHQPQVIEPADTFELFLRTVLKQIEAGNLEAFTPDLLQDAAALDMLRKATRGWETT